ncbi:Ribonuclease P protein subunit p40 [Xylographa trunciseda]|nr:Ribonuclease P protein subunit p40 [Xylographa trunciseda]
MLSEGRAGIDNLYFLKDGHLRLELPREVYERVGLVGHPIRDTGRKHMKTRYAIEINLRLPSMVHGKKGFERIVWAFKNVLTSAVTWLFYDFKPKPDAAVSQNEPINGHHPTVKACQLTTKHLEVVAPPLPSYTWTQETPNDAVDNDLGLLEWLDLVALESPRILPGDKVDPFLCQYEIPGSGTARVTKITTLSWRGFIPADWIKKLYLECFWAIQKQGLGWIALSASAFKTEAVDGLEGYVLLTMPSKRTGDHEHESLPRDAGSPSTPASIEYTLWEMTSGSARS